VIIADIFIEKVFNSHPEWDEDDHDSNQGEGWKKFVFSGEEQPISEVESIKRNETGKRINC
jgi:hypothetical protein